MTKLYAACLASYNNGCLHGVHVEVSTDTDAMQDAINAMLRASKYPNVTVDCPRMTCGVACDLCKGTGKVPSAEEWCVHDWDDDTGLFSQLGETSDLKAIARIAEMVEKAEDELGSDGVAIFAAYADHVGWHYLADDASDAVEACREAYAGTFDSIEEWAENFLDDTGALAEVPESLRHYIDFEAWARDAKLNGDVFVADAGGRSVHVFWNH